MLSMATRAAFIGIDRHQDARIKELTGARRDATALFSLFTDTLPDIDADLLVDGDATHAGVAEVIERRLSSAAEDDVVILSFSGHGTRDHRLVLSDTSLDDLTASTIAMADLAQAFKRSKARAILCILDCCFSGGASAKVIEETPVARDTLSLFELAGEGRILFAASNVNEPAYEMPGHRHGLLTKALIDELQAASDRIDLLAATANILDRVRAEAARLGITQTPVFAGTVTGGLYFPRLTPGDRFKAAFPEYAGVRVTAAMTDLAAFGINADVLREWENRFGGGLNELQLEAVNDYRIMDGRSLTVVAPTSSGKTFVGELAALKAVHDGRKAVFLLPYKAIVNEKYEEFQGLYRDRLDMRVVRCSGDYSDQTSTIVRGQYDLALLTYEMFLGLSVGMPHVLNQIGLVVLDEAQYITDPNRGISVELLLTSLIAARDRGVAPQVICLSAVIGNVNGFPEWLGTELLLSTKRPVPLREGVMDRTGQFQYVDHDGTQKTMQLVEAGRIYQRRAESSSQDVIVPLVRQLVGQGEKVLIFRNVKGATQGCANYLAAELGLPQADDALGLLPSHDLSSTSVTLRTALGGGTAFHNTNLAAEERVAVERSFRDVNGRVRVLAATSTMAAGINTPANSVVICENEVRGETNRPYTVAEYKNMAGRAGRLGISAAGTSILLAETPIDRTRLFRQYVLGAPEPLTSSFEVGEIDTWVIRLLAQIRRVRREDVPTLLANTYGGFLASKRDPNWALATRATVERWIDRMLILKLLGAESDGVSLTPLGHACGSSSLSLASALRLVEILRSLNQGPISSFLLMGVVQSLPEADQNYTPMAKKGNKEHAFASTAARRYGYTVTSVFQRNTRSEFDYYARAKRASILADWIDGVPVDEIERTYTVNPFNKIEYGNVRSFADNTRFFLRSAASIAGVMFPGALADLDDLSKRLEVGLPSDALGLLAIKLPLTRGEYLALYNDGVCSPADLASITKERLRALLGERRAEALQRSETMELTTA
jgi:helicase